MTTFQSWVLAGIITFVVWFGYMAIWVIVMTIKRNKGEKIE
jgi:hypothetical protein